jgi:putative transposase
VTALTSAVKAIALVEAAVADRGVPPGSLTLGTDNGSALLPALNLVIYGLGVAHRRGGYRDVESEAFHRVVVLKAQGALRLAARGRCPRGGQGGDRRSHRRLHHRPHSGLNYRTPAEVAQPWDDALGDLQTHAA